MNLDQTRFEGEHKGRETGLYFLKNKNVEVAVTNYGARIVALTVPGKDGQPVDVVTGFDSLDKYIASTEPYHGAIVGRYANRIARGHFYLNGRQYQLAINNPPNHLHGGPEGFHQQVWTVEESTPEQLRLSYDSADGEGGYPGNLHVRLTYHLSEDNALTLTYEAHTDAPTVINLTSHPFFNLNGQGRTTILNHLLQINADRYTPVDSSLIPTGIAAVDGTAFDFRIPMTIGKRIDERNEQLKYGSGYDHNLVLNGSGLRAVARATGDESGIVMDVLTDQPAMQLYSGNYMKSENGIKYGLIDKFRTAFCLETQHYPDAPNQPQFPSTILNPGEEFRSQTIYRFIPGS
jgi:aldose 1-epimerase